MKTKEGSTTPPVNVGENMPKYCLMAPTTFTNPCTTDILLHNVLINCAQAAEKRKEVEQLEARLTQAEDQRDNFRRKEKATVRACGHLPSD